MMYRGIEYVVSENNVHVINSYQIKNDEIKRDFITHLLVNVKGLADCRSAQSMFNEWKVHNALYQRGKQVERTKDVDFEFNQKWYLAIAYWFVSKILKER